MAVKTGYLPFTDKGAWLTEKLFGVIIYTQNNSSCMKAARERVLRSIVNYVTEVSERSQRACSKYDGYISFWFYRAGRRRPRSQQVGFIAFLLGLVVLYIIIKLATTRIPLLG